MTIELMALAYVDPTVMSLDGETPKCSLFRRTDVSDRVAGYIELHLDDILRRSRDARNPIPRAHFRKRKAGAEFTGRGLFQKMKNGDQDGFLVAAQEFADRMSLYADKRMREGFFVAVRRKTADRIHVAILKVEPHGLGARMTIEDGRRFLRGVDDVLDLPGGLHKGAVYPDSRRDSDLIVADEYGTRYFLEVIGATQYDSRQRSTKRFTKIVLQTVNSKRRTDGQDQELLKAEDIYRAVAALGGTVGPAHALNQMAGFLSPAERGEISAALRDAEVSPETVDAGQVRSSLTIGDLSISGSVTDIDLLRSEVMAASGGWEVTIVAKGCPRPAQSVSLSSS